MDLDLRFTPDVTKFETMTIAAGATGSPAAANLVDGNGLPCKTITITVETGDVRWRVDGGTPTAAVGDGHYVLGPSSFAIGGTGIVGRLIFYAIADAKIALSFGY